MSDDWTADQRSPKLSSSLYTYFIKGPELEFLVGLLKNAIIFIGIFLIAIGLHTIVFWLEGAKYPWIFVVGLRALEYSFFIGDIVWVFCKIIISLYLEIAGMIRSIR